MEKSNTDYFGFYINWQQTSSPSSCEARGTNAGEPKGTVAQGSLGGTVWAARLGKPS